MPFKSEKQRKYLWSQKPEVAKEIAYKKGGGDIKVKNPMAAMLSDPKFKPKTVKAKKGKGSYNRKAKWYESGGPIGLAKHGGVMADSDAAIDWHNKNLAGWKHAGYADDPDDIVEDIANNPGHAFFGINPDIPRPKDYYDVATYTNIPEREYYADKERAAITHANQQIKDAVDANRTGETVDDVNWQKAAREWQQTKGNLQRTSAEEQAANRAKFFSKGGPLGSTLRLGDDAADLARRNLERIRASKATNRAQTGRVNQLPADQRDTPSLDDFAAPVDFLTDFVPGVGEAKDVARAAGNIAAGNYGAAALDATAAAAGVVPGVGDLAAKGIRAVGRNIGTAKDPIRNFHGFERAQQRIPDLVPDQKTWNTVNTKAQRGEDIEIGPITRRDREGKGGKKDTRPGQEGRNAAVTIDGRKVPVVVVPHKDPNKKWHIITTRDRGRDNKNTGVLGGREYNRGGPVGGK